ncbi:MAG: hypothetical protein ACJ75H_16490 [Thermoanaerobaculia bacterium]
MILLPGLYLAGLGAVLAWALRRWWDPVPARVWAVFALVLTILFGPALFLGRTLMPGDILPGVVTPEDAGKRPAGNLLQLDVVTQILPWQAQVRRAFRAGEWPLWNDLAGAGMPLMADPQSQALEPLVLLALPLPLAAAVGVTAGLRVLLAMVFLFLLLRRQGLSEGPALFGGLSFGLGGFLLLWLNWPIGNSPALMPLVLYALAVTADRGERRDFLLLVIALASLLAGGHPETILYIAGVGGLFVLSRLFRRPAGERMGLLGRWALAAALAAGLVAPVLAPALRFLPQTHRSHWVEARNERMEARPVLAGLRDAEERRRTGTGVWKRLVSVAAPNAWGNSRFGDYWGDSNTNEDATAFVGGAALLLALIACFPARRRLRDERLFLVLAPASLLIALRLPGVPWLLSALPGLNQSISANRRLLLVVGFSVAYLAACTLERWRSGDGPRRWAVLGSAALLLALIAAGYLASPEVKVLLGLRHLWMGVQLGAVILAAVLLPRFTGRRMAILTAVAVLELLVIHQPANPSLPRRAFYPTTPAIGFLQGQGEGFRMLGLGDRLLPNAASVYGLGDIRISNPFKPYAYVQTLGVAGANLRTTENVMGRPEHPVYQLLGVRWVLAPPKMKSVPGLRAVFRDATGRVFERQRVLPRLFLPAAAESAGARPWPEWLAANPDFAARALVLPAPGRPPVWTESRPGESLLEIRGIKPARVTAHALLLEERLLASSIYQDGGWRLLLDGRPAPLTLANGPFVAAWLPAGEHGMELVYRAPGLIPGLMLAALALAVLAAWIGNAFSPGTTPKSPPTPSAGYPAPWRPAPYTPPGRG